MCLTATHKKAKIAKEDIHCYKVFVVRNTHLISPYQKYRWYINKLITIPKFGIINYSNGTKDVHEGLHAYTKTGLYLNIILFANSNAKVYNCIIPKGSKYYLGENEDIVSNQMIVTGRYKETKK